MLAAMAGVLLAVLVPRLAATRAERNARSAFHLCHALSRAQRELAKLPPRGTGPGEGGPYASPHVLAGGAPYLPGLVLSFLDAGWLGLTDGAEIDTAFGYRLGFLLAPDRSRWAFLAWPRRWGPDGEVAFAATQAGSIRRWRPLDPAAAPGATAGLAAAAWGSAAAATTAANDTWQPGWVVVDD